MGFTYHVVPRFDMAAEGGPLALGTVVADLETLVPLNGGPFHYEVPQTIIYKPLAQTDFKDTLATARRLNAKGWAQFLGLPVSAAAGIMSSKDLEQGIECESVTTKYFDDPTRTLYINDCLNGTAIHQWLEYCDDNKTDLYVVTGLKVATKLRYSKATEKKTQADGKFSGTDPHTQTEGGLEGGMSKEEKKELGFSVTGEDIVIGFRVNKFQCKRKKPQAPWTMKEKGIVKGNMQGVGDSQTEEGKAMVEVEPVDVAKESAVQIAGPDGTQEDWIGIDD